MAQLGGDIWQGFFDGTAERGLTIGDDAHNGHAQRLPYRGNQGRQVVLRGGQQTASQEDRGGETIAPDPQHLMAHVRWQALQGQDDPARAWVICCRRSGSASESAASHRSVPGGAHRAGSTHHPAAPQLLLPLRETPVMGRAQ